MNSVFPSHLVKIIPSNASQINELRSINYREEKYFLVALALKNEILIAGFSDTVHGKLLIWNLNDDSRRLLEANLPSLWSVDISSDGNLIAAGGSVGMIGIWDAQTAEQIVVLRGEPGPKNAVYSVAFSPDDKFLLSEDNYDKIRLWNIENFEQICVSDDFSVWPGLMMSLDGHFFAVRGHSYSKERCIDFSTLAIRIWDLYSRNIVTDLQLKNPDNVYQVVFGPHSDYLTIVRNTQLGDGRTKNMNIEIINWHTGSRLTTFEDDLEEPSFLCDVIYNPDGTLLVCAIESGYTIWDVATVRKLKVVRNTDIYKLAFSLDGKLLVSGDMSGDIRLWGITTDYQAG